MILPRAADVLARAVEFARAVETADIVPRQYYNSRTCTAYQYQRNRCRSSPWTRFGRWILAGILIFIALIGLLLCLVMRTRRKRRASKFQSTPMTNNANTGYYPPQGQPQQYNGQQQYNAPPGNPPATYAGNYGNNTHGANEGYYGQTNGVSQPANTYQK